MAQKQLGVLGSLAVGMALIGGGSAIAVLFCGLHVFECTRQEPYTNQGDCEIVSTGLLGSHRQTLALSSLQAAHLEESAERGLYRVVFQTTEGRFPLTGAYTAGRGSKKQIVEAVQAFIDTATQESVSVKQDERWMWYSIGGLFGLAGCTSMISTSLKFLRGQLRF